MAGDGRVNENVGLTAIQNIFHAEHDRLLAQIETTVQTNLNNGDISFATAWVLPGVDLTIINGVIAPGGIAPNVPTHIIQPNEWNGDRLFQAAKFGTETEYQHIVFDEFARMVAPTIHVAGATNVNIDPAITSEFANVVYRFGHSMLDENVNLYVLGADGKPVIDPTTGQPQMTQDGLIQAFTNPSAVRQRRRHRRHRRFGWNDRQRQYDRRHHPGHRQPGRQRNRPVRHRYAAEQPAGPAARPRLAEHRARP